MIRYVVLQKESMGLKAQLHLDFRINNVFTTPTEVKYLTLL